MYAVEAKVLHAPVARDERAEALPWSGRGPVRADRSTAAVLGADVHAVGAAQRHGAVVVHFLRERFPLACLDAIRNQRIAPLESVETAALLRGHVAPVFSFDVHRVTASRAARTPSACCPTAPAGIDGRRACRSSPRSIASSIRAGSARGSCRCAS